MTTTRNDPTRWARAQQLFHAALELDDATRGAWLLSETGDDSLLRADVEALLAADAAPATLLDRTPAELFATGGGGPHVQPVSVPEPLVAGTRVGHYRVVKKLGSGGMGVVFLADDERGGERVALKVLRTVAAALAPVEARARFLREIGIGTTLAHPNLLPVLEAGVDGETPWLATPYVEGETLRDRMRRDGKLPVADVLAIGRQVAQGLAWVHARGVVHRDVKPENILLAESRALLADFGVARAIEVADVDGRLTITGVLLGTPRYMSPEQLRGERADARSDVYALGCVLHEALAGEPPYRGGALRALIASRAGAPPDVRTTRPDVPASVAKIVSRALHPAAEHRPADAGVVAAALAATEA